MSNFMFNFSPTFVWYIYFLNVVHHLPFPKHSNPSVSLVFSTTQLSKWAVGVMCGYTPYMKVFKPPMHLFFSLFPTFSLWVVWPLVTIILLWNIRYLQDFSDTKLSYFIQLHLGQKETFSFPFVIILEPNTQWYELIFHTPFYKSQNCRNRPQSFMYN